VDHGLWYVQPLTAKSSTSTELVVYAKSSTSRWIASRSRKLSDRSCAEGYCVSAPSGCGCVPAPQTQRAERAAWSSSDCLGAALLLTPPAAAMRDAMQRAAYLQHPSCWRRLPPCA
jgi:hypothetical protein